MAQACILQGARVALSPSLAEHRDLVIRDGFIERLVQPGTRPPLLNGNVSTYDLSNCLVLPGLINAHDHLEFGLFPRLGRGPYPDARQWALDIYRPNESPIRGLLEVPRTTRLFWGGMRNLLSGVTTVCHHNAYEREVFEGEFPVRVLKRYGWSHSLDFSDDVVADFKKTPENAPFFIHLGEGTTEASRREIHWLDQSGLMNDKTVIIHGVALQAAEWELIRQRGARAVWCPSSNQFTLGQTLSPTLLQSGMVAALGNDSPLTAAGGLLQEIECALELGAGIHQLYAMVTQTAAQVLRLSHGEGTIKEGGVADLLVVSDWGGSPGEHLCYPTGIQIEAVFCGGRLMLAGAAATSENTDTESAGPMTRFNYGGTDYWTPLDLSQHLEATKKTLGKGFRLAGKRLELAKPI
ncbi:MAG: amidohydrolase family protein [Acidobacteria bacterium]|nr:amidohydrolase family protein [Acidobacteriota bacterium]MCI0723228.1 amidohydrolase family protein [Acidobacteriota bacterium]